MFEIELPVDPRLENTRANPATSCKVPVLFPPELSHLSVMQAVVRVANSDRKYATAVSAGFVQMGEGGSLIIDTYGNSESLGMVCQPGDLDIIRRVAGRNPFYYPGH